MIPIKVPVKILITGDRAQGQMHIGFAKNQMRILERLMSFQNLKQGSRTVSPFDGVVVECWSAFSLQVIRIHVDSSVYGEGEGAIEGHSISCPCFPCFSLGVILKVQNPERGYSEKALYDVDICRKESYLRFENYPIYGTGWETYVVGQFVMVTVDSIERELETELPDCLGNTLCVVVDGNYEFVPETLIVSPVHFSGGMQKWKETRWLKTL